MSSGKEEKQRLRRQLLSQRDGMSQEEFLRENQTLYENLSRCRILWESPEVYLYLSFRREADTWRILSRLWELGRRTAAPRICRDQKGRMDFYYIQKKEDLRPGIWGILEPGPECEKAQSADALVVVPGAVFDRSGARIGYGGGYYDRFFAQEPDHPALALAYDFQVLPKIPREEWDWRADEIWTPSQAFQGLRNLKN